MYYTLKSFILGLYSMKTSLFILIYIFCAFTASAQRFVEPDKMKAFNITVNYPEYTVKTQMLKEPKKMTPDVELTYHWYTAQKIMETKGGFDGKLLHGYYRSFYLNDQLFESGEFKYGIKSGEWKNWYPDGKLKEITNWKNGRKNGKYALYSDYGKLMASGTFKNDLLTGSFTTYDNMGNVSSKRKYKNGKEIIKQEKVKKQKADKHKKQKESAADPEVPKKEKKKLFGKRKASTDSATDSSTDSANQKDSATKDKKTQKDTSSKEQKSTEPVKEKRSFGERFRSFFKGKSKTEEPKATKKTAVTT